MANRPTFFLHSFFFIFRSIFYNDECYTWRSPLLLLSVWDNWWINVVVHGCFSGSFLTTTTHFTIVTTIHHFVLVRFCCFFLPLKNLELSHECCRLDKKKCEWVGFCGTRMQFFELFVFVVFVRLVRSQHRQSIDRWFCFYLSVSISHDVNPVTTIYYQRWLALHPTVILNSSSIPISRVFIIIMWAPHSLLLLIVHSTTGTTITTSN